MTQSEMIDWLQDMAEGPMAHNPEHADTCNMLTAVRLEIERLQAIVDRLTAGARWCGFVTDEGYGINVHLWNLPACDGRKGATLLEAAEAARNNQQTDIDTPG